MINEIEEYWAGRYLSASEAIWRILGFHITHKDPGVTALPVHLPQFRHHHRQYARRGAAEAQSLSLLERYFRPFDNLDVWDRGFGARGC